MFLLEHDKTRKRQINKDYHILPELKKKLKARKKNKKYMAKSIIKNAIYNKEAYNQLLGFYYLIL